MPEPLNEMRGRRAAGEKPDSMDLASGLRLGGERRGEEAERDAGDERSPVDHSITCSARCKSDGVIVRRRALPALRFFTTRRMTLIVASAEPVGEAGAVVAGS